MKLYDLGLAALGSLVALQSCGKTENETQNIILINLDDSGNGDFLLGEL